MEADGVRVYPAKHKNIKELQLRVTLEIMTVEFVQ